MKVNELHVTIFACVLKYVKTKYTMSLVVE